MREINNYRQLSVTFFICLNVSLYLSLSLSLYIYIYISSNRMGTQIWLSRHYRFISVENITILSVSSDDFSHVFLEVAEQQMWNYSSYLKNIISGSRSLLSLCLHTFFSVCQPITLSLYLSVFVSLSLSLPPLSFTFGLSVCLCVLLWMKLINGLRYHKKEFHHSVDPVDDIHVYIQTCLYIYIYKPRVCIYIYIYICVCVCVCVCVYKLRVCIYICIYIYKPRVCIYIYIYIYKRMYVNNSNCDSKPFKIYSAAAGYSWLRGSLRLAFESTGFRSQLRKAMSSHTDEFW